MIYISECEDEIFEKPKSMLICPNCHQKLGEVILIKGETCLRIKCRRCGRYIHISMTENTEKHRGMEQR